VNELININFDSERPTVNGRELHAALGISTKYADWFPRMCEYGFSEDIDYFSKMRNRSDGLPGKRSIHHQLTIAMAKELCMLQRSEIGREFRQYFIKIEEAWNSPESVMARALQFANNQLVLMKNQNTELVGTIAIQNQQIAEMKPKVSYYDVVLNCKDLVAISIISKDYGWSPNRMNIYLHEKGVQYKQGKIWLLYQQYAQKGYTSTKTFSTSGKDGKQHNHVHTYWTQAGRLFIYDLLKSESIVPLIEQEG
jgi:anti-repressor protein